MKRKLVGIAVIFTVMSLVAGGAFLLWQSTPSTNDSSNAKDFEIKQTEKLLGIPVNDFPAPQGLEKYEDIPKKLPKLDFSLKEQKLSLPDPPASHHPRSRIVVNTQDGSEIVAFCGTSPGSDFLPSPLFESNLENLRHRYGTHLGHAFLGANIYIGKRNKQGKLEPKLFFRDVGRHFDAPHDLTIGPDGHFHLVITDVIFSENNRSKVYWLVGDLEKKQWLKAGLIWQRPEFTYWIRPWLARWKDSIHLVWNWNAKSPAAGIFYLERTSKGFGKKTRIYAGDLTYLDMAVDQHSGRLVVIIPTHKEGLVLMSRSDGGQWTQPQVLIPDGKNQSSLSILLKSSGNGEFIIRTDDKEFLLRIKAGIRQ